MARDAAVRRPEPARAQGPALLSKDMEPARLRVVEPARPRDGPGVSGAPGATVRTVSAPEGSGGRPAARALTTASALAATPGGQARGLRGTETPARTGRRARAMLGARARGPRGTESPARTRRRARAQSVGPLTDRRPPVEVPRHGPTGPGAPTTVVLRAGEMRGVVRALLTGTLGVLVRTSLTETPVTTVRPVRRGVPARMSAGRRARTAAETGRTALGRPPGPDVPTTGGHHGRPRAARPAPGTTAAAAVTLPGSLRHGPVGRATVRGPTGRIEAPVVRAREVQAPSAARLTVARPAGRGVTSGRPARRDSSVQASSQVLPCLGRTVLLVRRRLPELDPAPTSRRRRRSTPVMSLATSGQS